ncbi:uncharacterized protein LOC114830299 isoform X2 [Esox lucius]|uniref:uncharacterized protein LOC114830299 isoform X2 n=1 Tax=Esox lucius TaxID=8010 RepID=UPI001476D096|nr:uncharacterized protein LOC114830299 isoform X2 [Esox lucius]
MECLHVPALVLYCFCLSLVKFVSPSASVITHPGHNVTLQCKNTLKVPGHVAWFKQVNESEPLCIVSMYSTEPYITHHNGFQPSRMEMVLKNEIILLKISDVDIADCGRYFCGVFNKYFIFINATDVNIIGHGDANTPKEPVQCHEGEDDVGTTDFFPLVAILAGVTAVLLTVLLLLALKIRRDTNRLSPVASSQQPPRNDLDQDPDSLNYATVNITSRNIKRKMQRRETALDTHVVYAATR